MLNLPHFLFFRRKINLLCSFFSQSFTSKTSGNAVLCERIEIYVLTAFCNSFVEKKWKSGVTLVKK